MDNSRRESARSSASLDRMGESRPYPGGRAHTAMGTKRLRIPRITLSTVRRKISHAQGTVLQAERFLKAHEGFGGNPALFTEIDNFDK
jgi:hypothetical protein